MRGEVVGINTAIVGPTYQGISFAIPSSLARDVYDKLVATGKVARGWLGVSMQELTPEIAERLELKSGTRGALVSGIVPGAPAQAAGLRPGDVIVQWNGAAISDPSSLAMEVASTKIGAKATITIVRDGVEQTFTVTVAERPQTVK
jgi:serine protease Do